MDPQLIVSSNEKEKTYMVMARRKGCGTARTTEKEKT